MDRRRSSHRPASHRPREGPEGDDGKIVLAFKNSGKFGTRYSALEFQDAANLDDGDLWPVSFALRKWNPAVEQKVAQLVQAAIS